MIRRLAACALLAAAACGRPYAGTGDSGAAPPSAADTLRGTFLLEGSDPMPLATLRASAASIRLVDAPAELLPLVGLEVMLRGRWLGPTRFRPDSFVVRGSAGMPARDGVLERRDADRGFGLRLPDRTLHPVRGAPAAFADYLGRRMWITESADGRLVSFGLVGALRPTR